MPQHKKDANEAPKMTNKVGGNEVLRSFLFLVLYATQRECRILIFAPSQNIVAFVRENVVLGTHAVFLRSRCPERGKLMNGGECGSIVVSRPGR